MKDLKIKHTNENGETINAEYDTIIDFINAMESDDIDIPMLGYKNIEANFFENPLMDKRFNNIYEVYCYCLFHYELWEQCKTVSR